MCDSDNDIMWSMSWSLWSMALDILLLEGLGCSLFAVEVFSAVEPSLKQLRQKLLITTPKLVNKKATINLKQ